MALSALGDKTVEPSPSDLKRVLGPTEEVWHHLVSQMEAAYGPLSEEWSFSGAKYGWTSRLRAKKRTVLYLIPQEGAFLVGVVLGDRALTLLRRDDLRTGTLALIDEAPRYGEGTGFRVPVTSVADCTEIETIIEAKMS
jgi:hypothetical protein